MKITTLRAAALACVAFLILLVSAKQASAATYVGIQIGVPPPAPPAAVYHPWARPYPGAVWIAGHHEWVNGRWVWVGGYYAYPPRRGAVWVSARYHGGYYYPGHWR
ncbi:MAG: hypothetical protein LV479_09230 [Methylacidiphilales bacterium]|nr:hypothetical protein [Candidatus Methylacidiphilales bacterium]